MQFARKPWLLAFLAAGGLIAVLMGVAQATSSTTPTVVLCLDENVVRPVNAGEACRAKEQQLEVYTKSGTDAAILAAGAGSSNADTLDNLDSTAFVRVGDPIDAATLDGLDSSAFAVANHNHDGSYYTKAQADGLFLAATATAADSDKLGGVAASAYARKGQVTSSVSGTVAAGACTLLDQPASGLDTDTLIVNVFAPGLPAGVLVRGEQVSTLGTSNQLDVCNNTDAPVAFSNVLFTFTTIF
jgi:hypothetical protein